MGRMLNELQAYVFCNNLRDVLGVIGSHEQDYSGSSKRMYHCTVEPIVALRNVEDGVVV